MIEVSKELFNKYELSPKHDIKAIVNYGRSLKAFKTNRLRAEATRLIERKLGLTQKEFAKMGKDKRLSLVHAQTRVLVNQLNVRFRVRNFNK